jgi:Ca2+-dependent lipid-binding protein
MTINIKMSHVIELSNITELDDNYMLSNEHNKSNNVSDKTNVILKKLDRDIKINNFLLFILNICTFIFGCGLLSMIIIIIVLMFI